MARLYLARTTGIGEFEHWVVVKALGPDRAQDPVAVRMFLDEARLAALLNHHNIAQVFEVGAESGTHFFAMEYVHGQDLRAVLGRCAQSARRIPLALGLTITAGAASGLHHAHERRGPDGAALRLVHRDVSPSNVMIGYDGAVKLVDFGIAKATARSHETQSGTIKGKFAYMSPEQCRGREVDRRSDVFALGILLYEITTHVRAFRGDSDFDTMTRIVRGEIWPPGAIMPGYPAELEAVVMKALSVDPDQRYQSAGKMLEAIEAVAARLRLSMSNVALGRFMRELYGDVVEPWFEVSGEPERIAEGTISNADLVVTDLLEPASSAKPTDPVPLRLDLSEPPVGRTTPPDAMSTQRLKTAGGADWAATWRPPTASSAYSSISLRPEGHRRRVALVLVAAAAAVTLIGVFVGRAEQANPAAPVAAAPVAIEAPPAAAAPAVAPAMVPPTPRTPAAPQPPARPEPRLRSKAESEAAAVARRRNRSRQAAAASAPAPAPAPAVAEAPRVKVRITSDPPGAALYLGDRRLGETPWAGQLPRGAGATFTLRKPRHAVETLTVPLDGDVSRTVKLRKRGARPRPAADDRDDSVNPF